MFELNGKVAVVTGASSGLGRDAAIAYAKAGADVVLLARRLEKLEEVANEIQAMGRKAIAIVCDVTKEEKVKEAIDIAMNSFSHIDILLNNAGTAIRGGVHQLSEEDWQKGMDINVKGMYLVSKYVVPIMMKQEYGKIVNISSINGLIADKDDMFIRHNYNASKAAVLGLSKGMAASYARYGITVNTVCPGLFETEMTANTLFKSADFMNLYAHLCPAGRPGKKGELNGTILFFSSDASSYVTGQYVVVDGGTSIV
ncbi:SDR family NAD(P)-dependent oxidoreductase [[Eubacterium] hominis]|uniref:SDR family NAD(P)-dependent oxidoreductase n=1 Tax=[Eubacterium] hominis TaxID=2764325 RepID=UPI003A4D603B